MSIEFKLYRSTVQIVGELLVRRVKGYRIINPGSKCLKEFVIRKERYSHKSNGRSENTRSFKKIKMEIYYGTQVEEKRLR